ncbi:MAG: DRTGG domain-containing protein [Desulfobacterota bacterium]|nr:DRTGG domain-containing protein [Thermodesulfobacteriota bacterium]
MTVNDIVQAIPCTVTSCPAHLDRMVTGAYVGDILSDVAAHAASGMLWITRQVHVTIVAIASLKELAAILIVNGAVPDPVTCARAEKEQVPILVTDMPAFEAAGRLHRLMHPDKSAASGAA